jgi:hypothetical protein
MTKEDIQDLGWICTNPTKDKSENHLHFKYGDFIMAVLMDWEPAFYDVMILDSRGVTCNVWENSDFCFHGMIKTKHDLERVMMFCGIIEYKSIS